jgi:surface protein
MTFCSFCRADLNDYTVYDSDSKTLTFYCDGHKGDWQAQAGCDVYDLPYDPRTYNDIDWAREHGEDITTVVFDESFARTKPTSTRFWFVILENLTSIVNIENLNTSEVTDMSYMFAYCEKMQSIDVTHFNTSKVKDMIGMFDGCSSLKTLDLTNWDTSNVEYMGSIFSGCEELTRITSLENLDLSKVISMTRMFEGCQKLKILNLTGWDTSNVTNMSGMFWNCTNLKKIFVGDNWNTEKVTSSNYMFAYCNNLVGGEGTAYSYEHIDASYACIDGGPDSETPGYLSTRPSGYAVYTSSNKTFTFYNDGKMDEKTGDKYLLTIDGEVPGWFNNSNMKNVTTVVFHESFASAFPVSTSDWFNHFEKLTTIEGIEYLNTDKVTEMSAMFNSCYKLKDLDLSTFNTSNVTNMLMMFCGCSQLTELDLCNFDTSNVTSMLLMFSGCSLLTELDLRSFDTHNVKQMDMMFQNCTNLVTIYANDDKWNTDNVETGGGMFYYCTSLVGGNGTRWSSDYGQWSNQSGVLYARIDGGPDNPGYLTSKLGAYALYDNRADIKTLTFYYDDQRDRRIGTKKYDLYNDNITPGWISDDCRIEKVVFDETFKNARPTTTYQWFMNRTALEFITGIENLNTSDVTDMSSMFYLCSNLGSLDLSHFNTSNVRNMWGMFCGCENLETLTLGSGFNTQNVTVMSNLFTNCKKLTSINLSSFDTGEVENMDGMFRGCSGLTSLSLSGFNTTKVTDMDSMFDSCSGLTSLNLSSFDTGNVTNMFGMFQYCENLKTITVGQDWSTQNVTVSSKMFFSCDKLKGGAGTAFDPDKTDKEYAHVDGLGGPGYLTAVSYGITVSGKAVTFANKYDVLGNETVYYDDSNNTLTLNNASLTSINIASSTPKNLRILVWGDCYVKHTASKGDAFITSIASTTIEGQGEAKLAISSKNGAGINIKRSSSAGLLVKDIDLVVTGNTAGILGSTNAAKTRFYSNLVFENTNCKIGRTGGEQGSVGVINKMVLEKCHWTIGEFDKTNHYVLANPMLIERNSVGITTGVENGQRNSVKGQRDEWYTIDGQKLSGKPAKKGIYIHNGKAVVH